MNKLINKIISEVSLDERVSDGMFSIEEDKHMEALRDYLTKKGIAKEEVTSFSNKVLEGKYPERQAYNAKGILVTFPTPEYKQEAIKRGTHFEENPMKKMANVFSDPSKPAATPPPAATTPPVAQPPTTDKSAPQKTNLPVSQAAPPSSTDTASTSAVQTQTTAAPQQTPHSTPTAEPVHEPTELPEPPPKSAAEKEADKNAIKTMLKGDDYMLEEMVNWFIYNAPEYLKESVEKHLKKKRYER